MLNARDSILDFVRGTDKLDLSLIDANTTKSGDQAFSFIGTQAFNAAGQLRYAYDVAANVCTVYGNVDGNTGADFAIDLAGVQALATADIVL